MIEFWLVAICVGIAALLISSRNGQHSARRLGVGICALTVVMFAVTYAGSGFGWGWPVDENTLVKIQLGVGVALGICFAAFGWIVSGHLPLGTTILLVVVNVLLMLLPSESMILRVGLFALLNVVLLNHWFGTRLREQA